MLDWVLQQLPRAGLDNAAMQAQSPLAMHAQPPLPEQSPPVAGQAPDAPLPQAAALLIRGGAVLHPERYVKAVWRACERLVQQHPASQATLRLQHVTSLAALEAHHGPFDAVIVAAGAAAATIAEIGGF